MPAGRFNYLIPQLRQALAQVTQVAQAGLADGQLLEQYLARRDGQAFEALVRRHGPMVWGVCRRLLSHHHDAEDAFQATFLVLVRRARSIWPREMVANWLYGVAHQTALKARATNVKRRARAKQVADMPQADGADEQFWNDLQPLLDLELSRLPEPYRAVIVLCDLEGKTRREVACQYGVPEGTVASRLARARALLAKRLVRRGLTVSVGVLATALADQASADVPASTLAATLKVGRLVNAETTAMCLVSANVATLTEGVLKAMLLSKLRTVAVVVFAAVFAGLGAGGIVYTTQAAQPAPRVAGDPAGAPPKGPAETPPPLPSSIDPRQLKTQETGAPHLDLPTLPGPPTPEQLRQRYLQLQGELSQHLTAGQVKQRVDELEREVAAAKAQAHRTLREKQAAEQLAKIMSLLGALAKTHGDTEAGVKARAAFDMLSRPTPPPLTENVLPPNPTVEAPPTDSLVPR